MDDSFFNSLYTESENEYYKFTSENNFQLEAPLNNNNEMTNPKLSEQEGEIVIEISNTSTKKSVNISRFNTLRKIQIHFFNFIVEFLNAMLKAENIGKKYHFRNLKHEYKNKISKNNSKELHNKSLGEIIKNKISSKYTKYGRDMNQKTFNKIKEIMKDYKK